MQNTHATHGYWQLPGTTLLLLPETSNGAHITKGYDVCLWQGGHVVESPAMNPYGIDPGITPQALG